MDILVLFTSYNRKSKTIKCIDSLVENNGYDIHFIILDDNSNDGTREALKKYDNVTVLEGDGNSFYSGGMRQAISYAKKQDLLKYEYVMMINDDVLFYSNIIEKLVELSRESNDGVIVGTTSDSNGNITYGGVVQNSKFRPSFKKIMSPKNKLIECDTFNANCVLIPTEIFIKTDNIDKVYTHTMGDFDYGLTIKKKGYSIYASNFMVGVCNNNSINDTWLDTTLSRKIRLQKKEDVKGLPFNEYFHFLNKNYGLFIAIIYSILPYIRIVFKL